jgi:hypothetical protein
MEIKMNDKETIASVQILFALHGGKVIEATISAIWAKKITDFCLENNISDETLRKAFTRYERQKCSFPDFGELCDLIKPSAKASADRDMRIIDEYCTGKRQWNAIPQDIRDAINAAGGVYDYQHGGSQFIKDAWIKKFKAARETDDQGYKPAALPAPAKPDREWTAADFPPVEEGMTWEKQEHIEKFAKLQASLKLVAERGLELGDKKRYSA